jgi:hypothetical protein
MSPGRLASPGICRADEARTRGIAAYRRRATQLFSQVVHKDKASLLTDLDVLQVALDALTG